LSLAIQLGLGLWLGHFYDMRIFMATGYLTATGQNPYIAQNLTAVFMNNSFQGMTSIGYPPPWALILGLVYRGVYPAFPNLLVYNLAIKLPVILANVGLAGLTAHILTRLGAGPAVIRRAWTWLLLSPFLFYFASAWGQFDSIVALFSLASLILLDSGTLTSSAILLALAVCLKPTALPILPVAILYLLPKSSRQAARFSITFIAAALLLCLAPFVLFRWDPTPILNGWNAHFTVGGGMSFMTFFELVKDSYQLPGVWWLLGLAWIPALGIGVFALRNGIVGFADLLRKSAGMILIFFLTRTWLSEPNIILVLPFIVILTWMGDLHPLALAAVWILPLIFTVFNASPPQLLFPSFPGVMVKLLKLIDQYRTARLLVRIVVVIPWQIAGWWIVFSCFKRRPSRPFAGAQGDSPSC
jgi:hypothetical protein